MRVLFLTHRLPYPPNRGDRIRSYHILRTLAACAEVDLISLVHDPEEEADAKALRTLAASVATARVPRLRNLLRGAASLAGGRPLTHSLLDAPALRPAIERALVQCPPDVVLAYGSGMARFALEPPLNTTPFVLDMVDVDSEKWATLSRRARAPMRWIYAREARCLRRFEAWAARRASASLVVNDRERAVLKELAPGCDVRVVPNGVDVLAFRPEGPPTDDPRVVFCGVMNYFPNEEAASWLAKAVWPLVRDRQPDARLRIVGSNPPRSIRNLAWQDSTIDVTGTVVDVRPFLWRSAVSAAPLRTARGIQNKVLESVAAGLPSVITPAVSAGLPREVLPACFVASSTEAFAAALLDVLRRPGVERRAIAARADLAALGWATQLAPLVDILAAAVPHTRS